MPKRRKNQIKLNSVENLETIMQEVYNDANAQINDANRAINELTNSANPEDVNDLTSIAKEKANLFKIKDSATKIKLELAKLEADVIKNQGNVEETIKTTVGITKADFKTVRDMVKQKNNETEEFDI